MGLVFADIRLTNCDDLALVMLCLNEQVATQLDLPVLGKQSAQMAGGAIRELDVVGPVEVRIENRYTSCNALVLPGENQVLLGAIPIYQIYYLSVGIPPSDPTIVWGTEIRMEPLEAFLR